MNPQVLEALVAQARFTMVKNGSRRDGTFVYYTGVIRVAKSEQPYTMANRWMSIVELWKLTEVEDHTLARSTAAVVRTIIPRLIRAKGT